MSDTEVVTPESTESTDIDALYDSIMSPSGDGPTVGHQSEPQETTPAPVAPAAPAVDAKPASTEPEYEYSWNGQKIKAPLSQIIQKASMGHDYSQKMAEFKRTQESFTKERSTVEGWKTQYEPIDKWVAENPQKWEKLRAAIEAEKSGYGDIDPNHPIVRQLQALQDTVNGVQQRFKTEEQKALALSQAKEDESLGSEIQSIRERYKDLDWETADESGRSKEQLVLKHALDNNIPTFKAAFFDLYQDDLEKRAEERGRGAVKNGIVKQTKTGLLSKTSAPQTGLKQPVNIKNKTYSELASEGLAELGITL